jgi:Histidine kinase-, DNA gyrase B-, and HSP90-like ATPase
MAVETIDIRPGVSVLAMLRHLNYKPWYALGEFVDNAVQSFISHRTALEQTDGKNVKLRVDIDVDPSNPPRISIKDNAAGIFEADYARAFRPAAIPPDRTGLSEFGMGMKSAACWFAPRWSVRTSALGEPIARTVSFDIAQIVNDDITELKIKQVPERPERHYTEIILEGIFQVPIGRTVSKLKEHLADIYRVFIRDGILDLRFNGDSLGYEEPKILTAPSYKDKNGPDILWRKSIVFDLGHGMKVSGFAALRETANVAKAGFALFRRGRVVQGSGDEGYRPAEVFGSSNSYRYQRLFGELNLEGFEVSHTKDGFRWDENEEPFLELLREHLDSEDMPLLKQAEHYRVRESRAQLERTAKQAVANATAAMESKLAEVLPAIAEAEPVGTSEEKSAASGVLAQKSFQFVFRERPWIINVEVADDPAESRWLVINQQPATTATPRELNIRVSIAHPFMVQFAQTDTEDVEALVRIAAALALAEVLARDSGVKQAGTVVRNVNELLRDALSEP